MVNQQGTTLVTSPALISHYLHELHEQKKNLLISFPGAGSLKTYQSTIQKIDDESKLLYLRMFMPPTSELNTISPQIEIKTSLTYGNLTFVSELVIPESSEKPEICRMHFPQSLIKNQKRSSYRVSLQQLHTKVKLELPEHESNKLIGICHDFSMGGTLCQLDNDKGAILETGMSIENCQIEIQSLIRFICKVELCHINELHSGQKQVGLKFLDMPVTLKNRISRVMAKIQRNNIRGLVHLELPGYAFPDSPQEKAS